ncbi:hypothetical protein Misp06_04354 [Microbulbifer sp. NBRC 101763]
MKQFNPFHILYIFIVFLLLYIIGVYTFYSPHFEAFTGMYIVVPQMLGVFIAIPIGIFFLLFGFCKKNLGSKSKNRFIKSGIIILILQLCYFVIVNNGYYLTV